MLRFINLATLCTIFMSCSMVSKVAVRATGSIIQSGSDELLTEGNWHNFNISTPGNLKLVESLWYTDQENEKLLSLLVKGYGAYAFASSETLALKDILLEEEDSFYKDQAILNYEKSIAYGLNYLALKGISEKDFLARDFVNNLKSNFDKKLSSDDYMVIFYFAQAFGGSINLQRDNVLKMGYFGHVREMLSWVCEKDPTIENGSCGLFEAVIEANTPTMLGGNQARAKKMFTKVIKERPYNLLARLSYIQYFIVPSLEEEIFEKEMEALRGDLATWYSLQKGERGARVKVYKDNKEFNLFNSVANERFKILESVQKEIF